MTATEIIQKYTNGEQSLVATNTALARIGAGFYLDINKHLLTEDEIKNFKRKTLFDTEPKSQE